MSQSTDSNISNSQPPLKTGTFVGIVFALVFAVVAFFSGVSLGSSQSSQSANLFSFLTQESHSANTPADLTEFWEVWDLMEEKFAKTSSAEDISAEERVQGAIEGLVNSYEDPYTVYLRPADAQAFGEDISGNFGGVGMEVGLRNGMVTVISPLPNTPADEAGILAGDIIVSIDGESTENMGIDTAVKKIRGEKGTEVMLSIVREGETEVLEIGVVRDTISIPTIDTELRGDVFIVSLYSFNALAEAKMQQALREYVRSGAEKMVLDLRGNPGGFLQSAISISSYFLPTGKVVVTESFGDDRKDQHFRSQGKVIQSFTPENLVVLVNGGSASASEIVAGALNGHDVAMLMGEQTFGKGSVQELVDLDSGASLKVTIARWLTPDGTSISDGGLTPGIVVEGAVSESDQEATETDRQMEAALEYLAGNDISSYQATSSPTE